MKTRRTFSQGLLLLLLACLAAEVAGAAEPQIDAKFPGGNIVVDKVEGDTIFLHQDQRDTPQFWFYWNFRVRGSAGRTLTLHFTKGNVFGPRGPAARTDGGDWKWLGPDCIQGDAFKFHFPDNATTVQFAFAIPYQEENLKDFLKAHAKSTHLAVEKLTVTPKGRNVELLRAGRLDGQPQHRVLLVARHHSCESLANCALEGLLGEDSQNGQWLRTHVEFIAVPFMDKDGVEDGDQGKLRHPHDHWLDYAGDSRYASVAALKLWFAERPQMRVDLALDLHCPAMRDQQIYLAFGPDPKIALEAARLSELLSQTQRGPLEHDPRHNMPFGKGWNTPATYGDRQSFVHWAERLPGLRAAATLELPYATANGAEVSPESARQFGRDLSRAIRGYLEGKASLAP